MRCRRGWWTPAAITPLGDVLIGRHPGRRSDDEITLFDGTGVGLQDLAVAAVALRAGGGAGRGGRGRRSDARLKVRRAA